MAEIKQNTKGFQKGNKLANQKKAKKQKKTVMREALLGILRETNSLQVSEIEWKAAENLIKRNIIALVTPSPENIYVAEATKEFAPYLIPKKTEVKDIQMNFEDYLAEQQNRPSNEPGTPVNDR